MNALNETALVSCYADMVALLVTLLLMVLSGFLYRRKNEALRLFGYLLLTLALTCVLSFICHATAGQTAPWCHTLAIAARTLWEWCAFLIILLVSLPINILLTLFTGYFLASKNVLLNSARISPTTNCSRSPAIT